MDVNMGVYVLVGLAFEYVRGLWHHRYGGLESGTRLKRGTGNNRCAGQDRSRSNIHALSQFKPLSLSN